MSNYVQYFLIPELCFATSMGYEKFEELTVHHPNMTCTYMYNAYCLNFVLFLFCFVFFFFLVGWQPSPQSWCQQKRGSSYRTAGICWHSPQSSGMPCSFSVFLVSLGIFRTSLNSSSIDELGNWCHPRLVGALHKYQAQQGGSMATLRARTSPASGHQPALSH